MKQKALTVAIAASLAAPMAAQAVDFTISGHINRGLFITDKDEGSEVTVKNNGSSATRIRATGSGELDTGHTAGIQLEYQEGNVGKAGKLTSAGEVDSTTGLTLRHANVWFSGGFGKVTLGQGSEASDSGVYSDKSGVFGVGQGQDMGDSGLGGYFKSLDGGGRKNGIRYDTPSLGPVGFAVSASNGDDFGAKLTLASEMMGSDVKAQFAYGYDNKPVSPPPGAVATETINLSFGMQHGSGLTWSAAWASQEEDSTPTNMNPPKPSYIQSTVGYVFGNNAVAASWWDTEEMPAANSEGNAIGLGFIHKMPKAGVDLYAAAQRYSAESGGPSVDETVAVVGARVKF